MDAPPPHEDPAPVHRRRRMAGRGRPVRARDPRPRPRAGPAADRRFRRRPPARDARRARRTARRELYELAVDLLVHLHAEPPMPGLRAARARPVARRAAAVHRLVLRRRSASTSTPTAWRAAWREVLAPVAADGLGAGHRAARLSCREYHAGRRAQRHRAISACSISRTRLPATPPTISPRCSRMRGATSTPAVERAMIDRYMAATGARP